jgi:hypothetical protein
MVQQKKREKDIRISVSRFLPQKRKRHDIYGLVVVAKDTVDRKSREEADDQGGDGC